MEAARLYTVVLDPRVDAHEIELDDLGDGTVLSDHHLLVRSPLTQSKLYHRIKGRLPDGRSLFVGALEGSPKMKGQAPGSVAWVRHDAG